MEIDWMKLLSTVLQLVVAAVLPVLAAAAVSWVKIQWKKFQANNRDVSYEIENAVAIAVKAAEQLGLNGAIDDKKKYALDIAEKWLAANGLTIDLDVIDAAIESAVFEQFNKPEKSEGLVTARLKDVAQ